MTNEQALENCRLFAARHRAEDWAKTILRFCNEGGATGSPLRAALASQAQPCHVCGEGTLTLRHTGRVWVKTCSHCKGDYGDEEVCRLNLAAGEPHTEGVAIPQSLRWAREQREAQQRASGMQEVPRGND